LVADLAEAGPAADAAGVELEAASAAVAAAADWEVADWVAELAEAGTAEVARL
jgi:hypothetical protein